MNGYSFIESVDMNASGFNVTIPAGSYEGVIFRFLGTNESTPMVVADLGQVITRYHNNQKQMFNFVELGEYNDLKFGAREASNAGAGGAFSYQFYLPFVHHTDRVNAVWVENNQTLRLEWTAGANLAARVNSTSAFRVIGVLREGVMKYILGLNRFDLAMRAGNTRPELLAPYSIGSVFIQHAAAIGHIQINVDGLPAITSLESIELLNDTKRRNKVETYAATGYDEFPVAQVDLGQPDSLLPTLNSRVEILLTGDSAADVPIFWDYFDYQPNEFAKTAVVEAQRQQALVSSKVNTRGNAAVAVLASLTNKKFVQT